MYVTDGQWGEGGGKEEGRRIIDKDSGKPKRITRILDARS